MAIRFQARLGAIDIAGDDYHGALGIHPAVVRRDHEADSSSFKPSEQRGRGVRFHRWYEEKDAATLYLGGERSSIRHRIYEKGKEQKDPLHLSWHRWEVMFRRTDKTQLALELLKPTSWRSAWLGSCDYLRAKFNESGARFVSKIEDVRLDAQEKAARVLLQLERQYGGVIYHLVRVLGSEGFVGLLERNPGDSGFEVLTSEDVPGIMNHLEVLKR